MDQSKEKKEWKDMCPSIKETDSNYEASLKLVAKTGCLEENKVLSECLKRTHKDWRQCKVTPLIFIELKSSICSVYQTEEEMNSHISF